jgi:hypothetical protein
VGVTEVAEQARSDDIIPPELAVKAMRDSGYRNTAYALAELIDNSAQAGARAIEVFCVEGRELISEREGRRIKQIAVMDNGRGMTNTILEIALQFGNGTHLRDRSGIGRFGMGLPNASISQCKRVDVWTWINGPDNSLHSYLDVTEIEAGTLRKVPRPKHDPLPEVWRTLSKSLGQTGTLVLWSGFDEHRLTWKSARATLKNTEEIVGRIYRKFIDSGQLSIRLVAIEGSSVVGDELARINDPLYLMRNSSTPAPFNTEPMFQPWSPEGLDEEFPVNLAGTVHKITVRISWARPETVPQDGTNRGDKPYGKHAAKNIGVSIVRAGRELALDESWAIGYDPTERWWGVEVDFPAALDEVFGVTNNKQATTTFSNMSQFDWTLEAEPGETIIDFKQRLEATGDPRVHLIDVIQYIRNQLPGVRSRLQAQTKGTRSGGKRHDDVSVEDRATTKFNERESAGHTAEGDGQVFDQRASDDLTRDLIQNKDYPEARAREIARAIQNRHRRVLFLDADNDAPAFFQIEQRPGGITEVIFNRQHPAFEDLVMALNSDVTGATDKDLVDRIENASDTLKMLFAAWARLELEDVPNKARIKSMRHEWGKMARIFLTDEQE